MVKKSLALLKDLAGSKDGPEIGNGVGDPRERDLRASPCSPTPASACSSASTAMKTNSNA